MNDAANALPEASARPADPGMLSGFWYPAARSGQISSRKLRTTMLLEAPLGLGRDARGRAFALRDVCPHRGMPLSCGTFDGTTVECCYHGWRFDARTGQCREIPSLTADSKLKVDRIFAGSFPCEERDGYVWVYIPDPEPRAASSDAVPPAPKLPTFSEHYRIAHLYAEMPVSVLR